MRYATKDKWVRVRRSRPCPICTKRDWCLVSADESAAICARIESSKRVGEAGWLHKLREDDGAARKPWQRTVKVSVSAQPAHDWAVLAVQYQVAVNSVTLAALAAELGLSVQSLLRLGIGWANEFSAWTFPLRDGAGRIVGINRRFSDGTKKIIFGGQVGLYLPENLQPSGRLFVGEGGTDTVALLDFGFQAVGRFSCGIGERHLVQLVRRMHFAEIIVVADGDLPGQRGAETLASHLVLYTPVKIIAPPAPHKDLRAWKQAGASHKDIQQLIDAAKARKLSVRVMETTK